LSDNKIVIGQPHFNEETTSTNQPYFDRQERIAWWNQKKLFEARVLVIGAGALGNEVLKNLALLGVGHILVIDFDTIEDSNLSRTVLFRSADAAEGANKAQVAAERTRALNPNADAVVSAIHGNVVWELGAGVYRHVDLVLGCLDNLEARLAVNLGCWRARKTWIDGGMWELSGSVTVYDSSEGKACYECGMTPDRYRTAKVRYSCTNETVKTNIRQGKEPTTQTTSAIVAAIQSQEAVKLLHGLSSFPGRQFVFNGASHFYTDDEYAPVRMTDLPLNPTCLCHEEDRFDQVLELPEVTANKTTARQLLEMAEIGMALKNPSLELGRSFVVEAICSQCGRHIVLNRPLYKLRDLDAVCPYCEVTCPACGFVSVGHPDCPNCGHADISELRLETFHTLSRNDPAIEPFLDYTLMELGIPPLHILSIRNGEGHRVNVELTGDLASLWN
jgi:adenylyltransferase/sulfurtransferase